MVITLLKTLSYYLLFPLILIILTIYLYKLRKQLIALLKVQKSNKVIQKSRKKSFSKIKKLEIAFVIIILIFMPFMNIMCSDYFNTMVHREERGGTSFFGRFYRIRDPVVDMIGPTNDLQKLKDKMYENETRWFPDQLTKIVDLKDLNKYPGRFTIYRLLNNRMILAYQYVSPIPILKTFGIISVNYEESTKLLIMKEETYVFPQNPEDGTEILFK